MDAKDFTAEELEGMAVAVDIVLRNTYLIDCAEYFIEDSLTMQPRLENAAEKMKAMLQERCGTRQQA